jgi:hypothetical protein
VVDAFEPRVRGKLWVNVEEHRHVNLLPRAQFLLLKTKALDLVEVEARLLGSYVVGGHPCTEPHIITIITIIIITITMIITIVRIITTTHFQSED